MLEKLKKYGNLLIRNGIIRTITAIIISIIGLTLSRDGIIGEAIRNPYNYYNFDIWFWIGVFGTLVWVGTGLVFLVFGLIINPIRSLRNKNKKK